GAADDERLLLEDLTVEPVPDEADSADEPPALFDVDDLDAGQMAGPGRLGPAAGSLGRAPGAPATTVPGPAGKARSAEQAGAAAPGTTSAAGPQGQAATRTTAATSAPDAAAEPAGAVPITNSDVAAAWQHMAASPSGQAWSVAGFIAHGTVPDPGAVHGPDDPQDITAWDGDGLRRTVASEQPGRDGTLSWDQAARWINAGMTSGDLRILLQGSRVIAFCDAWLEQVRDSADQAFYDAGHGATVIVQDCISRVTAAAAQAHGPDAAVPAAPADSDSYRREQVVTTAEQDQALATIRELGDCAHQAARRINSTSPAPAVPEAARQGALAPADGNEDAPAATSQADRGKGKRDSGGARHSEDPGLVLAAVS